MFSVFDLSLALHPAAHPLAGLRFLHPLSFAGFKVDGMFFDLFDDRFLLDSSFKPAKRAFYGFAFINYDKCQEHSPPLWQVFDFIQERSLKVKEKPCQNSPHFLFVKKTGSCRGRAPNSLVPDLPTRHHELAVLGVRPRHPGANLRPTLYFAGFRYLSGSSMNSQS